MKKLLCISLLLVFGFTLNAEAGQKLKVGIILALINHPDHITLKNSYLDELKKLGYDVEVEVFDGNIAFEQDKYPARVAEAAKRMEKEGKDLIYCTAAYHGIVAAGLKIPVIDSVTMAPDILGLAERHDDGKMYQKASNATGTIFGYSFVDIVSCIKMILPKAKKIGYLYNPASPISRPKEEFQKEATKVDLEVVPCTFNPVKAEVEAAIKKAMAETDVVFCSNDIAAGQFEEIVFGGGNVKKFPILTAIVPLVKSHGVLAAFQSDWDRAGRMCAQKTDMIFKQKITPNTLPVEFPDKVNIGLNLSTASMIGIEVPFELISVANQVVKE